MSNILNSEDFGLKIYNRFPPKYREDDVGQNFALKRYLQSLADGGFKYSIDEINGLTHLIDPEKVDVKVLPILFKQYGLEVYNGIPEEYLRYLLPKIGEAWSKKGSLSVVEFISSSLSGIKVSTNVTYDEDENPIVEVRFEMDYLFGNYFPNVEQLSKLLKNFLPFYCDVNLVYSYGFYDDTKLKCRDEEENIFNYLPYDESIGLKTILDSESGSEKTALFGEAVMGVSVLNAGKKEYADTFEDFITNSVNESGSIVGLTSNTLTNSVNNTLNSSFFTNGLYNYDVITVNGNTEVVFN